MDDPRDPEPEDRHPEDRWHEDRRHDADPDAAADDSDDSNESDRPVDRFRRTAAGTVVAAGMLGLRDALEGRPEKEEVTIVNEAPSAPPRDLEIVLDPDHPERSIAVVRRRDDDVR